MSRAELGRGNGGLDTVNVFDVTNCPADCSLPRGNSRFRCVKHNGNAVIVVEGGITRQTLSEFTSIAPCATNENG